MFKIRIATSSDANSLSKLAKTCFIDSFGHLYSSINLQRHLHQTCSQEYFNSTIKVDSILIAEKNNELVGYIKFGNMSLPIENLPKNPLEIHRLYVHPKHKRLGIGTSLMKKAFNNPMLKNAKNVYLSVYENNHQAQNFYRKFNFVKISEYNYYVGTHIDREYILHLKN